jgi:predicted small lipoprotein YifL
MLRVSEMRWQARASLVVLVALALAACGASGPRYAEHAAALPDIPHDVTRLTVFRTADHAQAAGSAARVSIDDKERGRVSFAGFETFHVPAGPHVLVVDDPGAPGGCTLLVDVLGGEEYFYEILPRSGASIAQFVGWMIGGFAGHLGPIVGAYAAVGAESQNQRCGGMFAIVDVDEAVGQARVRGLRRSP